jgi:NADH-ubiquinone oxidoreductase chain 3
MTSTTLFFVFIPLLAIILLAVNLIFAPHNPYQEKDSAFECGFHSFLGQNRTQFSISFFIFALLFLLFDLEILLVYPYVVSAYTNGIYGLVIMLIFFLALTLGFAFELGKNALKIDSKQMLILDSTYRSTVNAISSFGLYKVCKHITLKIIKLSGKVLLHLLTLYIVVKWRNFI